MDVIDAKEDLVRARRMFDKMVKVVMDEGQLVSSVAMKTSLVFVVNSFCQATNTTAEEFYQMLLDCQEARDVEGKSNGHKS